VQSGLVIAFEFTGTASLF